MIIYFLFIFLLFFSVNCNEDDWKNLLQELNVMLQLGQHPNVVSLIACCTEKIPYFLILEYVVNGKLLNYLRRYRNDDESFCKLTFTDLIIFAYQSAKGMQFISNSGVRIFTFDFNFNFVDG